MRLLLYSEFLKRLTRLPFFPWFNAPKFLQISNTWSGNKKSTILILTNLTKFLPETIFTMLGSHSLTLSLWMTHSLNQTIERSCCYLLIQITRFQVRFEMNKSWCRNSNKRTHEKQVDLTLLDECGVFLLRRMESGLDILEFDSKWQQIWNPS